MNIGIERELLLFDDNFNPVNVKETDLPNQVVLDFSDNQLEVVTGVFDSMFGVYKSIHKTMMDDLFMKNVIWPLSMPPKRDFEISIIGTNTKEKREYRKHLKKRYNNDLLLVSGIHVNVSFDDVESGFYFDLMKKIYHFGPLLLQFFSFSPVSDNEGLKVDLNLTDMLSIRNTSRYGYYNEGQLGLDFTTEQSYLKSIDDAISNGLIDSNSEIYSKVRLKEGNKSQYLEMRFFDVNPYEISGISMDQLNLLSGFLNYLRSIEINNFDFSTAINNFDVVATQGLNKKTKFFDKDLFSKTIELLDAILEIDLSFQERDSIEKLKQQYQTNMLPIDTLVASYKKHAHTDLGKILSIKKEVFQEIYPKLDMELSTKILLQECEKNNLNVEVIDAKNNVLEISNEFKSEFVFAATQTSLDNYSAVLAMNNKYLTKYILSKPGNGGIVNTPSGYKYHKEDVIDELIFKDKMMVVKPLDTNFGDGISILESNPSSEQINSALKTAFECSDVILVEEFIEGTEYRFLVIGDEVVSVIKRVSANVVGDGKSTISQLVEEKNSNLLRGTKYKRPLEKIKLGDFEKNFLKEQGLSVDDIIKSGETIYLRKNSNVSTGGDTVEVFNLMSDFHKDKALLAAKKLGVKICGVDMIISNDNYAVIEANFNPAIHMHAYPLIGYGVNVADKILKCLFNEN